MTLVSLWTKSWTYWWPGGRVSSLIGLASRPKPCNPPYPPNSIKFNHTNPIKIVWFPKIIHESKVFVLWSWTKIVSVFTPVLLPPSTCSTHLTTALYFSWPPWLDLCSAAATICKDLHIERLFVGDWPFILCWILLLLAALKLVTVFL